MGDRPVKTAALMYEHLAALGHAPSFGGPADASDANWSACDQEGRTLATASSDIGEDEIAPAPQSSGCQLFKTLWRAGRTRCTRG